MEEPTKGRLKLPSQGVDIPFTLLPPSTPRYIVGMIANDARTQSFDRNAGWVFEPDAPPLPTFVGYYTRVSNITPGGRLKEMLNLYRHDGRGSWFIGNVELSLHEVRARHADDPLVLLSVNKA